MHVFNYTVIYPCCQPLFVVLTKNFNLFYLFTTTVISNYAIIVRSFPPCVNLFLLFFWILLQSALQASPEIVLVAPRKQCSLTTSTLWISNHCHNCIVFIYMCQLPVLLFYNTFKIFYCASEAFVGIYCWTPI